ncbi:MAG: YggT family protein [Burkholderia gladioli]
MLGEIARFLINTLFTLFGAALLLRAWMQAVRVPPYNPVTQAVLQATNWLVLPLRRVISGTRGVDWASVVAAVVTAFVYVVLMLSLGGFDVLSILPTLVIVALLTVAKWALNLVLWMTILMALLSWLNPRSPAMAILFPLTAPLLNPLRRVLPSIGGMDLSPILLFVIVQVLLMVVTRATISMTLFTL